MHVTSYLYGETPEALFRFTEAACRLPCFREVYPVRRDDGQVIALVLVSDSRQVTGPGFAALHGILGRDIEIATACEEDGNAARVRVIRGRSGEVRHGEVITMRLEIEA